MFEGSIVALITPFRNGEVDEKKLGDLVEFQIAGGTSAIVPCGTTGESATLSYKEHGRVVELVVKYAKKRVPVIAGTGSNCTAEAIEMTRHAKEVGADATLQVVPYYNKPTPKGMIAHFKAIAKEAPLPMVLYNVPGRTGVNMLPAAVIDLARAEKGVVGIKEASGNLDQATEIVAGLPPSFDLLSGDDALTLPMMAVGAKGVISVLANIAPKDVTELCAAFRAGDIKRAQELHAKAGPLVKALFVESNPIPVKTAAALLGLCAEDMRLPLLAMEPANKEILQAALRAYGLLK